MYKVLMVGCGGSGAKTLAFMMDQLRADLRAHGVEKIPAVWQFVAVDSPVDEESLRAYGVPRVSDQGGHYVACGVEGKPYRVVDETLVSKLTASVGGLRHLATVMPPRPEDINVSIGTGAGQMRGLGRLLVLGKLDQIRTQLSRALERMSSVEAYNEAASVCSKVPGAGTAPGQDTAPIVFVVSSMAGGSGASMALEVSRILASIDGCDATKVSLMLYTADVFGAIDNGPKSGMPGNTLAFLGEAIAAQVQDGGMAGQMDADLHALLGVPSTTRQRPFHRIFPIGSKSATGTKPKPEIIYRAIGRGLARYVSSTALDSFVAYVLSNAATSHFMWSVDGTKYAWSSMGYASLSMGRDRYAEYVAQRLARRAMDHAWEGHMIPNYQGGNQQLLDQLWSQYGSYFLTALGFDVAARGAIDAPSAGQWLNSSVGTDNAGVELFRVISRKQVETLLDRMPPAAPGMPAELWINHVSSFLSSQEHSLSAALGEASNNLARDWSARMVDRLEEAVRMEIFNRGVSCALAFTEKAQGPIDNLQIVLKAAGASLPPLVTLPSVVHQYVAKLGNKAVLQGTGMEHLRGVLLDGLADQVHRWLFTTTAARVAELLREYGGQVLTPMVNALRDCYQVIAKDRDEPVKSEGVANLGTYTYLAWPREPQIGEEGVDSVPARFSVADNEVTIMQVSEYVDRFGVDVAACVGTEMPAALGNDQRSKVSFATREVLVGRWPSQGTDKAPDDLIERIGTWVPNALPLPGMGAVHSPASFHVHLRSSDLLERARKFVWRVGEPIHAFATQSIADYLNDPTVNEAVQQERANQMVSAMRTTIGMGGPYTMAIDSTTFAKVQPQDNPGLLYSFSKIPFPPAVQKQVQDAIHVMPGLNTQSVLTSFRDAVSNDAVTRVDVFGSAPSTVPVCYSGMLRDVADAWGQVRLSKEQRENFWFMHRARPLGAALPFSDVERRALIRGWFVASVAGALQIPPRNASSDQTPVKVFDRARGEWVAFPAPMITAPSQMKIDQEWLPAILESILLAYLESSRANTDIDEVFRPWRVLRSWADEDASRAHETAAYGRADRDIIQKIILEGRADHALPELQMPPADASAPSMTPAEARKALLQQWWQFVADDVDARYLPGDRKREDAEHWTNLSRRESIIQVPDTIDIAADMRQQALELVSIVEMCEASTDTKAANPFPNFGY